jgi:hypothetical protein
MKEISAAFYILNKADQNALVKALKLSKEEVALKPMSFWASRCRRQVPAPVELAQRLDRAFTSFRTSIDPFTGSPLVSAELEIVHANVMELVNNGFVSGAWYAWCAHHAHILQRCCHGWPCLLHHADA